MIPVRAFCSNKKKYLVLQRIAGVARNPGQINHQILKAFFHCEVNGKASRNKMMEYFLSIRPGATAWKFENNFNQMTTDEGNPHGYYFDCRGDVDTLFAPVASAIMEYEKAFR